MFATFVAAVVLSTSPVLPIPEAELWPAGDAPGTWDQVFTHSELERARALGGFDTELRSLIHSRLSAPGPVPTVGKRKTVRTGWGGGVEQWRGLAAQWPWPVDQVMSVMSCESGGDPTAISDTDDWGLMQINRPTWESTYGPASSWLDPVTNLRVAYAIWADQPGNPEEWPWWSCKP